ncbi:hypothetical protein CGT97_09665 [Vibrio metoecus]|nr:hypothetical protein CGT97_09665 [Vibrio metoecus]
MKSRSLVIIPWVAMAVALRVVTLNPHQAIVTQVAIMEAAQVTIHQVRVAIHQAVINLDNKKPELAARVVYFMTLRN